MLLVLNSYLVQPLLAQSIEGQPIKVVATTGIIADAVRNIGKELVQVTSLMGPGVDPHLYKATHGDLVKLRQAQLIVHNGLHLEGKLSEALVNLALTKASVAIGDSVPKEKLITTEASLNQPDPHIWFDVKQWADALVGVASALGKLDSNNIAIYETNYNNYRNQLYHLDQQAKQSIASIPAQQRVLLTAHDAFSYFGRAYNIEVLALQGISTASDFGLYDLKRLIDIVIDRKIKAAFVESSVPKKFMQALIEGTQARGHEIVLGGELYSDALGEPSGEAADYIGMVRSNIEVITRALK